MNTKDVTVISHHAMYAATLNGLIGYFAGDDKELWRDMVAMRLRIIKPNSVETDQEVWAAMFVYMTANLTRNIEIEGEVLSMLHSKPKLKYQLERIDYSQFELDDDLMKKITPMLVQCILGAGVTDLKAAFAEVDAIALEFGIDGMDEAGVKEALHGAD